MTTKSKKRKRGLLAGLIGGGITAAIDADIRGSRKGFLGLARKARKGGKFARRSYVLARQLRGRAPRTLMSVLRRAKSGLLRRATRSL